MWEKRGADLGRPGVDANRGVQLSFSKTTFHRCNEALEDISSVGAHDMESNHTLLLRQSSVVACPPKAELHVLDLKV